MISTVSSAPPGGGMSTSGARAISSKKFGAPAAPAVEQEKPRLGLDALARLARHGQHVLVAGDRGDARMLQHVTRLLNAKLGIARHHDRADARAGEQQQRVTDVIARQHADAVAFLHAAAGEQARRLRHRRAEVRPAPGLAPNRMNGRPGSRRARLSNAPFNV